MEGARRPAYLYLGGAAGVSASLAALADVTGRPALRRVGRLAALGGATVSVGALIHDLGRPERFLNMLRVIKPTSPLSVGSWILAPFGTLAAGWPRRRSSPGSRRGWAGWRASGSGILGPPADDLHRGPAGRHRRARMARGVPGAAVRLRGQRHGGGRRASGLLRGRQAAPARRVAVAGAALELVATALVERRIGYAGRAYTTAGPAGCCGRRGRDGRGRGRRARGRAGDRDAGAGCSRSRRPAAQRGVGRHALTGCSTRAWCRPATPPTPWSRNANASAPGVRDGHLLSAERDAHWLFASPSFRGRPAADRRRQGGVPTALPGDRRLPGLGSGRGPRRRRVGRPRHERTPRSAPSNPRCRRASGRLSRHRRRRMSALPCPSRRRTVNSSAPRNRFGRLHEPTIAPDPGDSC